MPEEAGEEVAVKVELSWNDHVATIRLNDPASRNAVTAEMFDAIMDLLDIVAKDARALILTGAGGSYCAGANIAAGMVDPAAADYDAGHVIETHTNPLMERFRRLPVPWISAVRGAAAGVGASLALAADMIVAGETAFFLQAFSRIGLAPDGGAAHLLVRTIGRPRAMELMLLGERLPARRAADWGLVNRVVPDEDVDAEAMALARRLAAGPASLRLIRKLAWEAVDTDWAQMLVVERHAQQEAGASADHREGVAAFLSKRAAGFVGQ